MKTIVTFGETMLRLSPSRRGEKINQAKEFLMIPGGSESNVAIALSKLGNNVEFVSRFPDNELSEKILKYLREHGVGTKYILRGGQRIGIYYLEYGIGPRPWDVIYDRTGSAFAEVKQRDFEWQAILKDALWFHSSGITPAVSANASSVLKYALAQARKKHIDISIDLNYRSKLWKWVHNKRDIYKIMSQLCKQAVFINGNQGDFQNALGIGCDINTSDGTKAYSDIARVAFSRFKNARYIAVGLMEHISASEDIWTGIFFVKRGSGFKIFKGPQYHITNIVDRLGVGDSFCGGLIHGILNYKTQYQKIVDFATALSGLKHTILGDASEFNEKDVLKVMEQKGSGSVIR